MKGDGKMVMNRALRSGTVIRKICLHFPKLLVI